MLNSFSDIIALWTPAELGAAIGEAGGKIRQWKRRNMIPPAHWLKIEAAARARAQTEGEAAPTSPFAAVTCERMAALAAAGGGGGPGP